MFLLVPAIVAVIGTIASASPQLYWSSSGASLLVARSLNSQFDQPTSICKSLTIGGCPSYRRFQSGSDEAGGWPVRSPCSVKCKKTAEPASCRKIHPSSA
jgi:hypothetical protein